MGQTGLLKYFSSRLCSRCERGSEEGFLPRTRSGAAGAEQPDSRADGWAAAGVSRGAAGGLLRRLRKQRRFSFLHRRNPF